MDFKLDSELQSKLDYELESKSPQLSECCLLNAIPNVIQKLFKIRTTKVSEDSPEYHSGLRKAFEPFEPRTAAMTGIVWFLIEKNRAPLSVRMAISRFTRSPPGETDLIQSINRQGIMSV